MSRAVIIDCTIGNRSCDRIRNWIGLLESNCNGIEIDCCPVAQVANCHIWLEDQLTTATDIALLHANDWWTDGQHDDNKTKLLNDIAERNHSCLFVIYSGGELYRRIPQPDRSGENIIIIHSRIHRTGHRLTEFDVEQNIINIFTGWLEQE